MRLNYTRLPIVLAILALLAALLSSAGYTPTQAQTHPNGSGGGVGQGMPHTSTIGTAALFPDSSEGFESSWPASGWALRDLSGNDGGEYFWGKRNCHPHTGSYAIWSAGGGAQGSQLGCLSSIYPNNMSTQALYGPFNLSDVLSATLTYNIYGSTEWDGTNNCPYDRFTMRVYTDSGVYSYSYFCGNWTNGTYGNGYYLRVLDLNGLIGPGKGNVWLSLEFTSDISNGDIGMLVDDIMLYAVRPPPTATPTPSITPTRTPTLTPTITPTFIPGTTPTATATDTPTPTNTPTPPPTNTIGPLTPQPIYLPLTLGAPLPTPLLQPAKACVDDDEPNNIPEDGKRLTTINDSCVGSFQNERTPIFDYYWIEPIKGQHIVVDLTGIPAGANYDVALYRQDPGSKYPQEALSNKPGQAPEHFEYTFDRNQRYYLRVSLLQKASGAKDTYILKVAIN